MCNENVNSQRDKTRQICAELGLKIVPYGSSWRIEGKMAGLVVPDLAGVSIKALKLLLTGGG